MTHAPADYAICPCCRTEFGVSDLYSTHDELRREWIEQGAQWGSRYVGAPRVWSAVSQLKNIAYICIDADLHRIAHTRFDRVIPSLPNVEANAVEK